MRLRIPQWALRAGWPDHNASTLKLIGRVFDGHREGLTRDDILDNVTLYWLTNTAVSSARLYWESKLAFFAPSKWPFPPPSASSQTRSTRLRGVGRSVRIPGSFISIRSPKADTLPLGSSRSSFSEEISAAFRRCGSLTAPTAVKRSRRTVCSSKVK